MKFLYRHRKILILILLAALALALFPSLYGLSAEELLAFSPESPALAALVLVGVFWAKSVLMAIPLVALYVSAGFLFPAWVAIPLVLVGLAGELIIGYFIGRYLGGEQVEKLIHGREKLEGFLTANEENRSAVCFIARLLPLPLPFDAVSMFFGAAGFPLGGYIFFSLLGLCPGMIPFVLAGGAVTNPLSPEFLLPFGISLAVTLISLLLLRRLKKRKQNNPDEKEGPV